MAEVRQIDARYHLAMLSAQGFNGGAQIVWDERQEFRAGVLTPHTETPTDVLEATALALLQRVATSRAGAN